MRKSVLAAVAAGLLCLCGPAAAGAEDLTVTSFDGTKISATFTPAQGLKAGERAPVILMTHGFGLTKETVEAGLPAFGQVGAPAFRAHGYSTLTWDSRGFGRSGGEVGLDSPQVDGRDVSGLIDYLATRPDVQLDGPGDPRIGMHGASYGGGIQWATVVRDHRVDAIAPAISWVSLTDALARDGRVKLGWGAALVGLGEASGLALGAIAPQGLELGAMPAALMTHSIESVATGVASPAFLDYLAARETEDRIPDVRTPALIMQGTADTLFTPSQAVKMRAFLRPAGVPVKMIWFCGGHGVCLTGNALADRIQPATLAWMDRWVKRDTSVDTGPGFEWVADDGKVRTAADFPLASDGAITASGGGLLALAPAAAASGLAVVATPSPTAVNVPIPAPDHATDVVGDPQLELHYSGRAAGSPTHVFAQIVDDKRGLVVGNQVTPIAVQLDGQPHTVQRSLEGVAMHMTPSSRYRLQLISDSTDYGIGHAIGTVRLGAKLSLPAGDAAATKPASAGAAGGTAAKRCVSRRTVTLALGARRHLSGIVVRVGGRRLAARRLRGNRVRFSLAGRPAGRVTVTVTAHRRGAKKALKLTRRYTLCSPRPAS
jgi:ABC-2 type transport system ATP-binding protein